VGVDFVFDDELLSLAAADVGLGLVVAMTSFDHTAVDATRPV